MDFTAYRFDCWPIEFETPELDMEMEKIDGRANFKKRTEIINAFFGDEDRTYTLGDGSKPPFKQGNELILRRYRTKAIPAEDEEEEKEERQRMGLSVDEDGGSTVCKTEEEKNDAVQEEAVRKLPKSAQDSIYAGRMLYHHDGVTVMKVQKRRELKGENKDFRKVVYSENYASQMAVIVARDNLQYVLIESPRRAFAPATMSYIIESTLNRLLMVEYNVMLQVRPVRRKEEFWGVVNEKQQRGVAVKSLHFKLDYPNMPWPDRLLGERINRVIQEINAQGEFILKGQHGQPMKLNTKVGERDKDVDDLVRYSCNKGNSLSVAYSDGSRTKFGNIQTGNVTVALPEDMLQSQNHALFPNEIAKEVILAAKSVSSMNDGQG